MWWESLGEMVCVGANRAPWFDPTLTGALATSFAIDVAANIGWDSCIFEGDVKQAIIELKSHSPVQL